QEAQPQSYTKVWVLAAIVLVAMAWWMWLRAAEAGRWERAVAALHNTQGIAVTQSDWVSGRRFLRGLSDPLARRPDAVLTDNGIDLSSVSLDFQPYLSLDPELVVKRARVILNAPETVSISTDAGVLQATGTAPHSWILRTRSTATQLAFLGV